MSVTAYVNARLIDPAAGYDGPGAVVVDDETIAASGPDARAPDGALVFDCGGHVLCPGLIDMRVFTGEPGAEHKETLATASDAAAAGGVTSMIVMPDTDPVIDDVALVDFISRRARGTAKVNVAPMAAITKGLQGQEMTEIGLLKAAGAVAFTDGRRSIRDAGLMRRALAYAATYDALICAYTEDLSLASGVMNESEMSARLGLAGSPAAAETIMLGRDLALAELTGARYHASQISCRGSLEAIESAKARGLAVTCAASVNHLVLNEIDIGDYRTFLRMEPPLRAEDDRAALADALARGIVDVIVSSHDP
ncbi:MAG: dihydroorotase, partial [Pseudomonadota bacterium]